MVSVGVDEEIVYAKSTAIQVRRDEKRSERDLSQLNLSGSCAGYSFNCITASLRGVFTDAAHLLLVVFTFLPSSQSSDMAVRLRADGHHHGVLRHQDPLPRQQEEGGFPQAGGGDEGQRERQRRAAHHPADQRKGNKNAFVLCHKCEGVICF